MRYRRWIRGLIFHAYLFFDKILISINKTNIFEKQKQKHKKYSNHSSIYIVLSASISIRRAYKGDPSVICSSVILIIPTINGGVITRSLCSGSIINAPGKNCL